MLYIALPENTPKRPSFYLAAEEYVARTVDEADCFFMWQVEPSVIFGRNQLIENEVNLDYCRSHHIGVYRRKSGGGCVYADMSNIMFSYITREDNVSLTFGRYLDMVAGMLRMLGADAEATGRNDIMIGGRKVSGNAFYHIRGRSIVHGTMLYDTDMQNMVGSITPSDTKLVSKGVKSVRQRITLLKDHIPQSIDEFKRFARRTLCDDTLTLPDSAVREIMEMEKEYLSPEFVYGNNPRCTAVRKGRIDGAGDFEVRIEIKNDIIKEVNMMGDYFLVGDVDGQILRPMRNVSLDKESLEKVLPDRMDDIVLNLRKKDFIALLTDN